MQKKSIASTRAFLTTSLIGLIGFGICNPASALAQPALAQNEAHLAPRSLRMIASVPRPDSEVLKKAQNLAAAGKIDESAQLLKDMIIVETEKDKRAVEVMALAMIYFRAGRDAEAEVQFKKALSEGTRLTDYASYYLGLISQKAGHLSEARRSYLVVLDSGTSSEMAIEAKLRLGEVLMLEKNFLEAAALYQGLRKQTRSSESAPTVVFNLYRAEHKLGRKVPACKTARDLYAKYPHYVALAAWGSDLSKDQVDGEKTGCIATPEDLKTRIRTLQLAGEAERASRELTALQDVSAGDDNYAIDSLLANYMITEGRTDDAMKLILKNYKTQNSRPQYQLLLAKAASRAGEYQAAVGAFMKAYELAPHSKDAANALFQAAFTSYQFQDYDGATRKFTRFIQAFPHSKLARDSQWHLAWMRYLRGDYSGAFESLSRLSLAPRIVRRRHRRIVKMDLVAADRVHYWEAMSLIRMGRASEAIPIFQKLVRDPAIGYYAMLSYYRLTSIPGAKMPAGIEVRLGLRKPGENGEVATPEEIRAAADAVKAAEAEYADNVANADDTASEETAGNDAADDGDESTAVAEAAEANKTGGDSAASITVPNPKIQADKNFRTASLASRFERARDLMSIGLDEGARRELMEIERRAHSAIDRKLLVAEYINAGNFYRASYMGEIGFGALRLHEGLRGDSRQFWSYAYPRAFENSVIEASKSTAVPEEFIWGIMRAESHFKSNAASPVGALGLMQLMPFTGRKLAGLMSLSSFEPSSLLQPEMNIKLGTRYLQRLLEKFSGSVPLAAAGYNAGPHRVHAWIRNFGQLQMDEFIDHIPFLETRNYVKNVVRNYQIYSLLYSGGTHSANWLIKPVGVELNGPVPTKEIW